MTKNNDWIEQLRDKMDGFQEPAPEGLWQDIEAALSQDAQQPRHTLISQDAQQPRSALIVPIRRWTVAAAIAAALIGGATWFYKDIIQSNNLTETSKQAGSVTDLAAPESYVQAGTPHDDLLAENSASSPQQVTVSPAQPTGVQPAPSSLHESASLSQPPVEQPAPSSSPKEPASPSQPTVEQSAVSTQQEPATPSQPSKAQPSKTEKEILRALEEAENGTHRKPVRYGVNLYAANDLIGISNSSTVVNYTMAPGFYGFDTDNETTVKEPVRNYNEHSKHYQPYSIGLTGRIGLTDRWSLSTGLVYTRLRSDFTSTMGGATLKQKQTLHEIGIPLNAMYRVWSNQHLVAYAVAGGQADFNFKATLETDGVSKDMDKDRVQWSVNAGIGAQYNFIPSLGIYLEPGVKYYFDNGSPLENTFKDKQCNFNIQFGIRYNIGE
jgi:hypothetical protein